MTPSEHPTRVWTDAAVWIEGRCEPETPRLGWRVGRISRLVSPGYGWCKRCLTTWNFVEGHTTIYEQGPGFEIMGRRFPGASSGCFPLCEKCWRACTIAERLPYYRELWDTWVAQGTDKTIETWLCIAAAVREGR